MGDPLGDAHSGHIPAFEQRPAFGQIATPGDRLHQFGSSGAHQSVDTDDLTGADLQRQVIDHIRAGRLGDDSILNRECDAPKFVASRRAAEVEIIAHHVAHNPLEVDLRTWRLGGHIAVAQHDRVVGDL